MIKSTRNQMGNALNPYQGDATKILCVCSAGLLRSPTLAKVLSERGYNTRAVGYNDEFALITLSTALLVWADVIIFVDKEAEQNVVEQTKGVSSELSGMFTLDIPDMYEWGSQELVQIINQQLEGLDL